MITVLGLDPGTSNMAWSVVRIWGPTRFQVLEVGMVQNPMKDMKDDIRPAVKRFVKELRNMMRRHAVTHIGAERFQARGLKGNTGELVAFMLGLIATFREPSVFITASQWKNNFNKYTDLKAVYKRARIKPHEFDATCIGLYCGQRYMGTKDVFGFLSSHENRFLATVEARSITLQTKITQDQKKAELRDARQSSKKKARKRSAGAAGKGKAKAAKRSSGPRYQAKTSTKTRRKRTRRRS